MTVPPDLQIEDGMAILRFTGEHALSRAADRVTEALIYARENGIRQLLADGGVKMGTPRGAVPVELPMYRVPGV